MKSVSVVMPVLAPAPWLQELAEFSIRTLELHASNPFELIVVEAVHDYFSPERWVSNPIPDARYKYIRFNPKEGGVKEINAGIDAARGEFIVTAGTDVIAPPAWDEHLLRCFEERPNDCGVASLSAFEPNATIGPHEPCDMIVEGMFSPFMMFRKGWRFDEAFRRVYQDSDLIMRMYEKRLRAYRSCRAHVWHLGSVTNKAVDQAEHSRQLAVDERLFYQRWGKSPTAMFGMIRAGQMAYGREHLAWQVGIHRHE